MAGGPDATRALVAASLGWMLDSFDVMLYALVLASLMSDLGMTAPAIRATAQGFTYDIGRLASAVAPFAVGSLAQTRREPQSRVVDWPDETG